MQMREELSYGNQLQRARCPVLLPCRLRSVCGPNSNPQEAELALLNVVLICTVKLAGERSEHPAACH